MVRNRSRRSSKPISNKPSCVLDIGARRGDARTFEAEGKQSGRNAGIGQTLRNREVDGVLGVRVSFPNTSGSSQTSFN